MRKKNQCSINIDKGVMYACCNSFNGEDCIYGKINEGYCRWRRTLSDYHHLWTLGCKNKEAANYAAYRIVKKLQKKFWC